MKMASFEKLKSGNLDYGNLHMFMWSKVTNQGQRSSEVNL